jgi:RimJ/RimL family protein N-acetyltransferase
MHLVWSHDYVVCEYVRKAFPHYTHPWRDAKGIGIVHDGELVGGLVVDSINTFDALISIRLDSARYCNRTMMQEIQEYLFGYLKLSRVTLEIHPKHKKSRKFAEALGAKLEGKKRRGYDGHRNVLIYGLLPEEAKFYVERPKST